MKGILSLILALALILGLVGCSASDKGVYTPTGDALSSQGEGPATPTDENAGTQVEQAVTVSYYPDRSLNPLVCTDFTNRALFSLLYQGLFSVDRDYNVRGVLCDRYLMAEDMRSYTFYVDKNATFSDGTAVRAADVVASLQAAWQSDYYKGRFTHVESVSPTLDGGILITLSTAYENLPILLDIPIVKESQTAAAQPVGSGPYFYDATGKELRLRRRSDWWCDAQLSVNVSVISLTAADSVTQIRDSFQFRGLSLVCADPCSDEYADYRCDYELWDAENGVFTYIDFNDSSAVFQNTALRAAVTWAIDRDTLCSTYYRSFGRSACVPASPLSPYYSAGLAELYGYAPEKFAQAVTDAQLSEETQVTFLVNCDDSLRTRAARAIADSLTQCGLPVVMKELSGQDYLDALENREYDLYLGQTKLSANMDLTAFFAENGALNPRSAADPEMYALCLQALENHGNYYTLYQRIMDQGLLCPVLFCSYAIYGARGSMMGLTPARDSVFYYEAGTPAGELLEQ